MRRRQTRVRGCIIYNARPSVFRIIKRRTGASCVCVQSFLKKEKKNLIQLRVHNDNNNNIQCSAHHESIQGDQHFAIKKKSIEMALKKCTLDNQYMYCVISDVIRILLYVFTVT